jgi:hypothetical protein
MTAAVNGMEETPPLVLKYCIILVFSHFVEQIFAGGSSFWRGFQFNTFSFGPESLQIVKFPLFMVKNMDYNIIKIQENP